MLNSIALTRIRNSAAQWLKDTCTIEKQSDTLDELGSPTAAWQVVHSDVPCRITTSGQQNNSAIDLTANAETMTHMYRLSIPALYELDVNMRVTINEERYQIVRLETDLTDEVFHQAILVRQT